MAAVLPAGMKAAQSFFRNLKKTGVHHIEDSRSWSVGLNKNARLNLRVCPWGLSLGLVGQ